MISILALFGSCTRAPEAPSDPTAAQPTAAQPDAAGPDAAPPDPEPSPARIVRPVDDDPALADARCNDGTPYAYTLRPGTDPTWIIDLAGGFFCNDLGHPCSERARRLTTAPGKPRLPPEGIFDTDPSVNPTFAAATHVEAHYCSSDFWLGDSVERQPTTGDPDQGWYFSGRRNLAALIGSLAAQGLDQADPAVRILMIGTSAGGIGLMGNFDAIVAAWPDAVAESRLKIVLDGSWVPAQDPEVPLVNAGHWGPLLPACEAALAARGEAVSRCVYGDVWWSFAKAHGVPVLVQISGLDKSSTPLFGIDTPAERAAWKADTRASLADMPWVFSGAKPYHIAVTEARFGRGPEGRTLREVIERFWASGPGEQVFFGYDASQAP